MNGYVDQSAGDLNLCVYAGIPDIESSVHIFEEHKEEIFPGAHIHIGIVGASHFFSFRVNDEHCGFAELLACAKPPKFSGDALVTPLRLLAYSSLELVFPPFQYLFSGEICDATPENLAKVAEFRRSHQPGRSKFNPRKFSLAHDFSSLAGSEIKGSPFPPETLISFQSIRGCPGILRVSFDSVHTYPNEDKVVFTSSVFRRI